MSSLPPSGSNSGGLMRAVCIPKRTGDGGELNSQTYRPKVEVKARNSLYIISYTEVPPFTRCRSRSRVKLADGGVPSDPRAVALKCNDFEVFVYIDIPTIDYYKDELQDTKLSKFNKKFKLHLLREAIFDSFTNGNDLFWDQWMQNTKELGQKKTCTIAVSSSGSLRYVETIKFLIEACHEKLSEYVALSRVALKFELEVTPTSRRWFTTFLNKQILEGDMIEFVDLGSNSKISESTTTPFKEYYAKLSAKFAPHTRDSIDTGKLDSIVIITNSTGVKALLTILSDRPLTSYIVKESIDALHDTGLRKKDPPVDSSEEETPLKRESSSLLSFQNSLLTSNKDKSVRIRSLSLNQRSNRAHAFSNDEMPFYKTSSREISPSPGVGTLLSRSSSRYSPAPRSNLMAETTQEEGFELAPDGEGFSELDDDDEDDDEDEDEGDEDGLSFNVPSRLSRSGSSDVLSSGERSNTRTGRFRSLSLMDPAFKSPFDLAATEDQASSTDGSRVTNIYIHDGEFEETESSTKRTKKKLNKALLSRQNSSNGLIPPEFYSRISSPCTSASSSNSSLHDLNMAPGTFSKWLGPDSSASHSSNFQTDSSHPLFEKNLINKSFEETRNQSSANLFSTLMAGRSVKNPLALNFKSNKVIPPEVQIMDEEDRLMSGYHNGNSNFSAEDTSDDERRSVSTVVPDRPSFTNSSRAIESDGQSVNDRRPADTTYKPLSLSLKLYDDEDDGGGNHASSPLPIKDSEQDDERPKPKYKKAISLDLYGDSDLDNAGGWILGGNAR
ncbi:hypothetical protein HG536_0C00650 [Torulaspora globosa]|uniref:Uncharacterized protein n=1 Tax=Torulaspora globosa TaxID=48254 RepID=A0A7G3ZEG2_9SACH|nr:uncharacterized protein HG536_0C00650 [Torulaspora globosa]QLL31898.1 hypothetical protein HG536_0C00650 [Torulaspora globosa]